MNNTHENPVAGIRSWRADDRGLLALHQGVPWQHEMRSKCVLGHTEPVFGCQCGLWARYSLEGWEAHEGARFRGYGAFCFPAHCQVVGVVSSAGCEIIRGETGFRAGEMRIEALIAYNCEVEALGTTVSLLPALQALADKIGVPVISPDEIEMFCALEGYELLSPLVGEEPVSVEGEAPGGWNSIVRPPSIISYHVDISAPSRPAFRDLTQAADWTTKTIDVRPTPEQVIQNKKNRKPMYADFNKRKGLDQPR